MELRLRLLLLVAATASPARAAQLQPLQVLPCNATDADMHWLLDAGAGRFKTSVALKHAGGGSAECAECSATSGCVAGPCGSSASLYFTRTATVGANFTLTRTGGKLCLTATTGGIGSPVALRDCSAALHGNAAWHYDAATKLLHSNAVQFSQKFDLCLTAPDSAPAKPPVAIASLSVDAAKTTPLPHFWSACVGSSHGKMWVRADWQQHLAMAKQLGGFSQVRGHGILDEDVQAYSTGQTYYNAIFAYKYLLSIGMTPLVELSFVPNPIANGTQTCFHYAGACSPPTDGNMDKYGDYVFSFVSALVEYFGVEEVAGWKFEIFNEPDLDGAMGCPTVHNGLTTDWKAPNCQYFKMFREAALAIKRVDKRLLVGGPATSGCRWLESLAEFTKATKTPIDFLSTHSYPNDPTFGRWEGGPGGQAQTDTQYKAVAYAAKQARGIGLPLYMTEWSSDPGSRSPYVSAAAFSVSS